MLRIAICDDDPLHLNDACARVDRLLKARDKRHGTRLFSSAEDLLAAMDADAWQPDLAVLDIEMGGADGITLAQELNRRAPACRIIFLTGYVDYAPEVYVAEHIWFVVKSRVEEFFEPALDKALKSLEEGEAAVPGLVIREEGKNVVLPLDSILYIEKVGRRSCIRCTEGDHYDARRPALLIPEALKDHFLHCHQGYWVNFRMIRELDHEEFILRNGSRIPIGRAYRDAARKTFFDRYLFKQDPTN